MGLLKNPLRVRGQRLPLYHKVDSSAKERYSDDEYESYSSEDSSEQSYAASSSRSSRDVLDSIPGGRSLLPSKRKSAPLSHKASIYPYRLPARVSRYIFYGVAGILLVLILSLVRASQVENWKVAHGKVGAPPPPPPLWERFPFLERYYGGIRTLQPIAESGPEHPSASGAEAVTRRRAIPESKAWQDYPTGSSEPGIQECFLDAAGKTRPPPLRYYEGRPSGFPQHVAGSYEVLKLPEDICFERFGRLGPYGFGYSVRAGGLGTGEHGESEGSATVWEQSPRVDFRHVDWADVQRRCFRANAARFNKPPPMTPTPQGFYIGNADSTATEAQGVASNKTDTTGSGGADGVAKKQARTAVVVRCWDDYLFREDDIANMRSMITELALASGGRYDVHLLVQVKDDAHHPIWADHEAYEKRIRDSMPPELQGLVTLWTETQMLSLYQGIYDLWSRGPELPVHGVYRGLSMAMQHFAYMHPEYEYFWQWEMDIRYTGHYYDLVTKLEEWAKAQPRKGLWERNSRFYFPAAHGSWEDFSQMSRVQSEMGAAGSDKVWDRAHGVGDKGPEAASKENRTVWGPRRALDPDDWFEADGDAVPPTSYEADRYRWGVGEEADYISLNPLFDPEGTTWQLRDDITGFNRTRGLPPRRAAIITTSRMSRRLLMTMHRATAHKKQMAFPEMWPATVALHHGLKAVFAPHPVYVDRRWPIDFMAQTFNGGRHGSSGGSRTSIFGEREHNMRGLSWFYNSGFAPNLYRRWLGLKVNNDGGDEFETTPDASRQGSGVGAMPGGEGRMCLPPMLLHPVKDVELPIEAPPPDDDAGSLPASDPAA